MNIEISLGLNKMHKDMLLELISLAIERDLDRISILIEKMRNLNDIGLILRAEYIMSVFDIIHARNEEEKMHGEELLIGASTMIDKLKEDNVKYSLNYNMYDEFNLDYIQMIVSKFLDDGENQKTQ